MESVDIQARGFMEHHGAEIPLLKPLALCQLLHSYSHPVKLRQQNCDTISSNHQIYNVIYQIDLISLIGRTFALHRC